MKLSLNWLRRYVDLDWDAQTIADRLTASGVEIEDVIPLSAAFTGVRVGKVESVRQHPGADRLRLATVAVGGDERLEVVCGAPNCRAGLTVAYAGLGAQLPGDFTIKRAKIRGVESLGMLCSAKELGIGEATEGIMELDSGLAAGQALTDALPIEDVVFDAGVTANRGDCLSHLGVARELAALSGAPLKRPAVDLPRMVAGDAVPVHIDAPERCARYVGRVMHGLRVGPSPFWMQRLLEAVGTRAINNVVDVTNFVLLEYGQPLHAFDLRDVAGPMIRVRLAEEGERLTTLDGQARSLTGDELVICDGERPVALAGVMGGENSEVKADTTSILLESAWFAPVGVRETSRRLNLRSESSHRFERSVDPVTTAEAASRALHLLANLPGGESASVVEAFTDNQARVVPQAVVSYRPADATRRLGVAIDDETQRTALQRYGFDVAATGDEWQVTAPSWRNDVAESADLVEEVIRFVGYDALHDVAPRVGLRGSSPGLARRQRRRAIERRLNARGFHQALNFSFQSTARAQSFGGGTPVALVNPLTEDLAVMRRSLLPGLLANAEHNLRHGAPSVRLFESGRIFRPVEGGKPAEADRLGLVWAGEATRHWTAGVREVDFFDLKGLVHELLVELGLAGLRWSPAEHADLHPRASATVSVGDVELGVVGVLHPAAAKALGVTAPVVLAELDLQQLLDQPVALPRFAEFSRHPAVRRDLAVVLPAGVDAGQVLAQIEDLALALVDNVEIFDVYEGGDLEAGERSLGVSITYRAPGRTLTDADVTASHEQIVDHLTSSLGARRR